jgi:hypothetical protein
MALQELIGDRFGRLVVISRADNAANGAARWLSQCDCGGTTISVGASLRRGTSKSCGCLQREAAAKNAEAARAVLNNDGVTKLPEYQIWAGMNHRCSNPEGRDYHRYGGRGITVCSEWATSFHAFYRDMGDRPSPRHSLDRKDVNGPYVKWNCRWATAIEQQNNKRNNRVVSYRGANITVAEAYRIASPAVQISTVRRRIDRGWSIEEALQ